MNTLNEGNTPFQIIPELNKELGIDNLILKREDLNPTGSHKDRYISYAISKYLEEGIDRFVISSTGNASISAIRFCFLNNLSLTIYISPNTPESKLKRIYQQVEKEYSKLEMILDKEIEITEKIKIIFSDKAVSNSIKYASKNGYQILRGSTDKYGYQGYMEIAKEIHEYSEKNGFEIHNIILPCSSGTTAYGIYNGFELIKEKEFDIYYKVPAIHIVQTEKINTIAREFDKEYIQKETSIAQAISDKVSHRYMQILESINNTDGFGWIVSDEEILNAQKILNKYEIYTSNESAMTIAAILKAKSKGKVLNKSICIITGK